MRLFNFDYLENIICYEEATGGGDGGGGGEVATGGTEGGGVVGADGNLTNEAKGGIVTITGGLEDGEQSTEGGEQGQEQPQEQQVQPTEISLDGFDQYFDFEEGEKEAIMEKITGANITPEQFQVFQELTGDLMGQVAEMQEQHEKLNQFIKRDYAGEAQKLTEAKWTKADVQDVLSFAGNLLGEGGTERLSQVVNSAEVLFALKALKDKVIGSDNSLEGAGTQTEPTYTQDAFVQDIQKYYKMSAEGKEVEAKEFLAKIKERGRKYGDAKLKADLG